MQSLTAIVTEHVEAYTVCATDGNTTIAEYLFAEKQDAEQFCEKMKKQGYTTTILLKDI